MLEGRHLNLRIVEKEDLPLLYEWENNPDFRGEYEELRQETKTNFEKLYDNLKDEQWFFIEKKDGEKIGNIVHEVSAGEVEVGYFVVPNERRKGYATEAIMIMVDYLFLSKDLERIQAKS